MEKKILIFILLLIGNGIVNAVEYPFVPSYSEHFVVEDYGSELVGSAERPFSNRKSIIAQIRDWMDDSYDFGPNCPISAREILDAILENGKK